MPDPHAHRAVSRAMCRVMFFRADTIRGGSDEIRRDITAERVPHLPEEPR